MIRTAIFVSKSALKHFCNGGIVGGPVDHQRGYNLSGLTLTLSAPADSCTFTGNNPLSYAQVRAQIKAAIADVDVVMIDGHLGIVDADVSAAVAMGAGAQDARAVLGFAKSGAVSGIIIQEPAAASGAKMISIEMLGAQYVLTYDDGT